MKTIFTLLLVITFSLSSWSQDKVSNTETTTYYFIRHAEKDRTDQSNRNPDLNKQGEKRAKKWSKYFRKINLHAIYSTNYNRTQQTAKPTANKKKLEVLDYDPRTLYTEDFKNATQGKAVLVVGHSNTTPAFVNMILGNKKYNDIDDNDNSKLFIVTVTGDKISDEVRTIN
nr:phosphoglycerate mutase family protein [uncultured Psychroserpens sp.]